MGDQLLILISAGLVSNLILDHMLGVDMVVAVSRKIDPVFDLARLMLLALPVTTVGTHLLISRVLLPLDLAYLQISGLVLLTSLLVLGIGWLVGTFKPALHARIELYIPLLLVNCSVLGVALLNSGHGHGILGSISFGLGTAAGFGLVLLLVAAIRERVAVADVPVPFRGPAILLVTLGLLSMAFMGFNGIGSYR